MSPSLLFTVEPKVLFAIAIKEYLPTARKKKTPNP